MTKMMQTGASIWFLMVTTFAVSAAHAGVCETDMVTYRWRFASYIVSEREGLNDGVVSVASAKHGPSFEIWRGDHMNLVNRPNPRSKDWRGKPCDYLQLARRAASLIAPRARAAVPKHYHHSYQ